MAAAVFLAVLAVGTMRSVLASQGHFDITVGLPDNATCESFIHANEACRKAVLELEEHEQLVKGTEPEMKPGKFTKALTKCYHKRLTKDERHHVCQSKRIVQKVLRCFKRASYAATPKISRKASKKIYREYRKCFLEKFKAEQDSEEREIMFPRVPIIND